MHINTEVLHIVHSRSIAFFGKEEKSENIEEVIYDKLRSKFLKCKMSASRKKDTYISKVWNLKVTPVCTGAGSQRQDFTYVEAERRR